jgi:hypothetical protein
MYYYIQQTCLAIGILGALLMGTEFFEHADYFSRTIFAISWGLTTMAGVFMYMYNNVRRLEKTLVTVEMRKDHTKPWQLALTVHGKYSAPELELKYRQGDEDPLIQEHRATIDDIVTVKIKDIPKPTGEMDFPPSIHFLVTISYRGQLKHEKNVRWWGGTEPVLPSGGTHMLTYFSTDGETVYARADAINLS